MKKSAVLFVVLLLVSATSALAQEKSAQAPPKAQTTTEGGKMFLDVMAGVMRPGGDADVLYKTAPSWGMLFAYRVAKHVAVDGGFEMGFNASRISANYTSSTSGKTGELSDLEVMVPMGASAVFPLSQGKAILSAGAGLAYMNISEHGPGDCSGCGSRSGWGVYEMGQLRYFPKESFGVGVTVRFVQVSTDGTLIGTYWEGETKDRWTSILGTFTMRF